MRRIGIDVGGTHTDAVLLEGDAVIATTKALTSTDVLTGIITGLLAQGYASQEAALLGMYLHGLAGDLAVADRWGPEALIASDIIDQLGAAFNHLKR